MILDQLVKRLLNNISAKRMKKAPMFRGLFCMFTFFETLLKKPLGKMCRLL
jgi:hypothetical protein